jgi:hypothetical protein
MFADALARVIGYVSMPRDRGTSLRVGVFPDRVFSTLAHQTATMLAKMSQQISPFHAEALCGTSDTRVAAVSRR